MNQTDVTSATEDFVVHLDERWAECRLTHGRVAWPPNGFVASIFNGDTVSPYARNITIVVASFAAEGQRDILIAGHLVADIPELVAAVTGALHELAAAGYLTVSGGVA